MSKLTELIQELCPQGVEYHLLGDLEDTKIVTLGRGKVISKKTLAAKPGDYPVYSSSGMGDGEFGRYSDYMFDDERITWSVDGGGRFFYRAKHRYSVTNVSGWLKVNDESKIIPKFLFHALDNSWQTKVFNYTKKAHPSVVRKEYCIPVPPLEVQQEIVRVLDAFTDLEQNLAAELELRQKQFEEYRLQAFGKLDADYVGLQSIATIGTGSRNTNEAVDKGAYPFYTRGEEALFSDEYDFDETSIITAGDGVGVGKTMHFASGKFALHQRAYRINITDSCVEPRFVFHLMKATFLNYMIRNSVHASVTSVRKRMLDDFPVSVLATEVQQDIVSKLDAFESLIQSIEQEISLRRKQYEFYRDELLTFAPKES